MFTVSTSGTNIYLVNPINSGVRAKLNSATGFITTTATNNNVLFEIRTITANGSVTQYGKHNRSGLQSTCYIGSPTVGSSVVTLINAVFPTVASSGLIFDLYGYVLLPGECLVLGSSTSAVLRFSVFWEEV